MIDGVYWDKEQLRVSMKEVIEFQKKHGVPIFVGEFSVINWAKGGDRYLADMIELFEEYGWDWAYHAFREWDAWSIEHEGKAFRSVVPSPGQPAQARAARSAEEEHKVTVPLFFHPNFRRFGCFFICILPESLLFYAMKETAKQNQEKNHAIGSGQSS